MMMKLKRRRPDLCSTQMPMLTDLIREGERYEINKCMQLEKPGDTSLHSLIAHVVRPGG